MTCGQLEAAVPKSARVRDLNDAFRRSFVGGRVVMTAGVAAMPPPMVCEIVEAVKNVDRFDSDNDPFGEHDFGSFEASDGSKVFWKVDLFDRTLRFASPDASDPAVTTRVLTIGLASEY